MNNHALEVRKGQRFEFGKNWRNFLEVLNEDRISQAEQSLKKFLDLDSLKGLSFVDVGSGSGLFSLAARRLGASVYSFDYDPQSVECAKELRRRFSFDADNWKIEEGSVLDQSYLKKIGKFDIVYSWGVLHHTGAMWQALENVETLTNNRGRLFIAIYNHQIYWTAFNRKLKYWYNRSPAVGKMIIGGSFIGFQVTKGFVKDLILFRNPLKRYRGETRPRGMARFHDWIDWIGGFPFEAAKPEEIFTFYHNKGYRLINLKTAGGGHGCNEFVFLKEH